MPACLPACLLACRPSFAAWLRVHDALQQYMCTNKNEMSEAKHVLSACQCMEMSVNYDNGCLRLATGFSL